MIKTRINTLLGIEFPILQGGMAWISESNLASAVSNAGGLGQISSINAGVDVVRQEIRKCKAKTSRPFGVNIMLMSPIADDIAQMVIEEEVPVVTTGAGMPGKYMSDWLNAGIKVIPVVSSSAIAKRMENMGACAVIAEGRIGRTYRRNQHYGFGPASMQRCEHPCDSRRRNCRRQGFCRRTYAGSRGGAMRNTISAFLGMHNPRKLQKQTSGCQRFGYYRHRQKPGTSRSFS